MMAEDAFDAVLHVERTDGRRRIAQIGRLESLGGRLQGVPLAQWSGIGEPQYAPEWLQFLMRWSIAEPAQSARPYFDTD